MRYERTIDQTANDLFDKGKDKFDEIAQKGMKQFE